MIKVTLLCSDVNHPIFSYLEKWVEANSDQYDIKLLNHVEEVTLGGDILFLVSCSEIVKKATRDMFTHTLVLHASDLPEGRGWSPHIWDIVDGKNRLVLSLLEAKDGVDTGDIWKKTSIHLEGSELYDEINQLLFNAELELISWACENFKETTPINQSLEGVSYHRKRTPNDSELDISKSIREQFNLLRVCDPERFPAFFVIDGNKYTIRIERGEE
jgi:methionyl-tRNA formyltransferase